MRRLLSVLNDATGDPVSLGGPELGLIALDLSLSTSSLTITGGVALTGSFAAGGLAVAGTLVLEGAASLDAGAATLSSGALLAEGGGATLSVDGTLTLSGDTAAIGGGSILAGAVALAGGTLDLDAASAIGVGGASDAGTIEVAAGGTLSGYGQLNGPLDDWGTLLAQGGTLSVFGAIAGGGTLAIGADGTLYAPSAISPSLSVVFVGPDATLELLTLAQDFVAPLTGFATGDAIAFAEATISTAVWQDGTLWLTATDGSTLGLWLPGDLAGDSFVAIPDGMGGSTVKLPTASISGLVASDITLGDGGDLLALAGTASDDTMTIDNQVALTGNARIGTLTLAGTLAVLPGATLTAGNIAGFGVLVAEGSATIAIADATALAGTLDLLGGGSAVLSAATLAGGAFLLDSTSSLVVGGATAVAGTIEIGAGATLAGYGRLAAPTDVGGTLRAQGGVLVIGAAVSGGGSIAIAGGATLDDFAPISVPVSFAAGATLALDGVTFAGTLDNFGTGDVLEVAGTAFDTAVWSTGKLSLLAGGTTLETIAVVGNYAGQTWQVAADGSGGTQVQLAGHVRAPLDLTGALSIATTYYASTATVEEGGALTLTGGTLSAPGLNLATGGLLDGYGSIDGTLDVGGTVAVAGGIIAVSGSISGNGTILIGNGATLYSPGGIAAATDVMFTGGNATLELLGPSLAVGATIDGLEASASEPFGNAIDIADTRVTGASYTDLGHGTGALALTGPLGSLGTLTLAALSAPPSVVVQPDGDGGSLIQLVPCFVAGTGIATPDGDVSVEHLHAGDTVLTNDGPQRLRWTGRRRCDATVARELRPVRITAGALGRGLPWHDLLLSPRHALLLRGVLVPAVALVNGDTIRREPPGSVVYHHLGLDAHGTVWADGVAAETWLPSDDPVRFDDEDGMRPLPGPACAPLIDGGAALAALRRRVFGKQFRHRDMPPGDLLGHVERVVHHKGRARVEGWALNAADQGRPVKLQVVLGGCVAFAIANRWRPDLDRAGLAGGSCGFALDLPCTRYPIVLHRWSDGVRLPGPA